MTTTWNEKFGAEHKRNYILENEDIKEIIDDLEDEPMNYAVPNVEEKEGEEE